MSMDELSTWEAYVMENGPMNFQLRMESAIARVAAPFLGKNVKPRDLMPWPKEPEPEATFEEFFAVFKNAASHTNRGH